MIDNENRGGELFKYRERRLLSINLVYDLVCDFRRRVYEGRTGYVRVARVKC